MIRKEIRIAPCPVCGRPHDYLVEAVTVSRLSMPSSAVCQSPRPVSLEVDFTCPETGDEFPMTIGLEAPSGSAISWTEAKAIGSPRAGGR